MSFILGLVSAAFGGCANLGARKLMRTLPAGEFLIFTFGIMAVVLLPGLVWWGRVQYSLAAVIAIGVVSMIDLAGNMLYFQSFKHLDAVTASSILSISPLFTLGLFPFVYHNNAYLNSWQIIGILIVVTGLVILNSRTNGSRLQIHEVKKAIFPLGAAFLFGINVYGMRFILDSGYANPYAFYWIRAVLIGLVSAAILRPKFTWITRRVGVHATARALLVIGQWLALLYGLQIGNPAIVKTISDASPLFVVVFANWFLKEKPTPGTILGAIVIVVGMILVA